VLALSPQALAVQAWTSLFRELPFAPHAKALAEHLVRWHDAQLRVVLDHDALVLEVSGNRR